MTWTRPSVDPKGFSSAPTACRTVPRAAVGKSTRRCRARRSRRPVPIWRPDAQSYEHPVRLSEQSATGQEKFRPGADGCGYPFDKRIGHSRRSTLKARTAYHGVTGSRHDHGGQADWACQESGLAVGLCALLQPSPRALHRPHRHHLPQHPHRRPRRARPRGNLRLSQQALGPPSAL